MNDWAKLQLAIDALQQIKEYDSDSFESDYFAMKEIAEKTLEKIYK